MRAAAFSGVGRPILCLASPHRSGAMPWSAPGRQGPRAPPLAAEAAWSPYHRRCSLPLCFHVALKRWKPRPEGHRSLATASSGSRGAKGLAGASTMPQKGAPTRPPPPHCRGHGTHRASTGHPHYLSASKYHHILPSAPQIHHLCAYAC